MAMEKSDQESWDIIIRPATSTYGVNFKELWRYRDLVALFIRRDFVAVYKQTILGPIWFVLQPLMTTITFVAIFAMVARLSTNGIPPILFYLSGLIPWTLFSTSLTKTSTTFITNIAIFSKVYFPRLAIPVSVIASNLITFGIQFVILALMMVGFMIWGGMNLNVSPEKLILLPGIILIMALLGLSFGIIISAMTTKYRDLNFLVGFGVQLLMYISPVIFPLSSVEGKMETVLLLNPMSSLIETFRLILFGVGEWHPLWLLYSMGIALVAFFLGGFLFARVDKTFADTV